MTIAPAPTARLLLRPWRDEDLAPFAALNADPAVMEHFPKTLSRAESDNVAEAIVAHFDTHGFGLWAVEVRGVTPFIGFTGLSVPRFEAHFTPTVEVGWRLARAHWGKGYASEAARAALAFGFEALALVELVSFTAAGNHRSRRVMERIGMREDVPGAFDHPALAPGHPLRAHALYRLARENWERIAGQPVDGAPGRP